MSSADNHCKQIGPRSFWHDLDPNCLAHFEKNQLTTKKHAKLPSLERVTRIQIIKIKIIQGLLYSILGKRSLNALEKSLNTMLESGKALKASQVKLFQMILGCQATDGESHDPESRREVWRFCIQGLVKVVKDKENRDLDVARKILEVLDTYAQVCISMSGFTINVLTFLTLFTSFSQFWLLWLKFAKCMSELQTGKTLIRVLL